MSLRYAASMHRNSDIFFIWLVEPMETLSLEHNELLQTQTEVYMSEYLKFHANVIYGHTSRWTLQVVGKILLQRSCRSGTDDIIIGGSLITLKLPELGHAWTQPMQIRSGMNGLSLSGAFKSFETGLETPQQS